MPYAHVMIGAPGSGKSTKAEMLAELSDSAIVCLDTLRKELWGDEAIQGPWEDLQTLFRQRVCEVANSGQNIIIDATHARKKYRRETIEMLRSEVFRPIYCCIVHPPLDVCLSQNARRDRKVPQRVVIQMWETINQNLKSIEKEFDN
jgi:predicted kinase